MVYYVRINWINKIYSFRVSIRMTLRFIAFANGGQISFTSTPAPLIGGVKIKCGLCYNRAI